MTNSIFTKTLCAAAALALTATSFSNTASAQSHTTSTAVVNYSDLDRTSDVGRATFEVRIKGAIRKVCGSYDTRNLKDSMDHRNCVDEANLSAKRASVTVMAAAAAGTPIETAMVINN